MFHTAEEMVQCRGKGRYALQHKYITHQKTLQDKHNFISSVQAEAPKVIILEKPHTVLLRVPLIFAKEKTVNSTMYISVAV